MPPSWFAFEYVRFYLPNVEQCSTNVACDQTDALAKDEEAVLLLRDFEHFKYVQESAGKIWAAVVLFFGALYFREH